MFRLLFIGVVLSAFLGCKAKKAVAPSAQGDRKLGIHITSAESESYSDSFTVAKNIPSNFVNLHFIWGSGGFSPLAQTPLEADDGSYQMGEGKDPTIADQFFGILNSFPVSLTIGTYDTNANLVPLSFVNTRYNDAALIARFKLMIDELLRVTPNVPYHSLQVGNEIDISLGTDAEKWSDYKAFLTEVLPYIRQKKAGLLVSTTITHKVTQDETKLALYKELLPLLDFVSVTYYGKDDLFENKSIATIESEIEKVLSTFPDQKIRFNEMGHASGSTYVGGSETDQAAFIEAVFKIWDANSAQIPSISFLNLTEWSQASVDLFGERYQLCPGEICENFKEHLQTLGLRKYSGGTAKEAFTKLKELTSERDWE